MVSLLPLFAQPMFVKWVKSFVPLGYRGRGERLTTHHHLTPRLRTSEAVPPLHLRGVDREKRDLIPAVQHNCFVNLGLCLKCVFLCFLFQNNAGC